MPRRACAGRTARRIPLTLPTSTSTAPRISLWPLSVTVATIVLAFAPVAAGYTKRYSVSLAAFVGIYGCFVLLLIYLIAPAMRSGRALLDRLISGRYKALVTLALLVLSYFVYAVGTGDFRWTALLRIIAIAGPVLILYSLFPVSRRASFSWQDIVVAVWLVGIVLFHLFKEIWNVPANLDFMARLFIVALGALCWTYIRPIPDLGYRLQLNKAILLAAAKNFLFFAAIAVPLGFALGFTAWHPRWHGTLDFLTVYLEIFLFIAVLEELFFRGFLQNLFEKSLGSWWAAQLIASCIFGLFHILHAPFPNWRYVILASIAGWFYGSAYRSGGTLLSSAMLHAMVDTVWRTFFTKS